MDITGINRIFISGIDILLIFIAQEAVLSLTYQ